MMRIVPVQQGIEKVFYQVLIRYNSENEEVISIVPDDELHTESEPIDDYDTADKLAHVVAMQIFKKYFPEACVEKLDEEEGNIVQEDFYLKLINPSGIDIVKIAIIKIDYSRETVH
jgi:hypothetical protein